MCEKCLAPLTQQEIERALAELAFMLTQPQCVAATVDARVLRHLMLFRRVALAPAPVHEIPFGMRSAQLPALIRSMTTTMRAASSSMMLEDGCVVALHAAELDRHAVFVEVQLDDVQRRADAFSLLAPVLSQLLAKAPSPDGVFAWTVLGVEPDEFATLRRALDAGGAA